MRLDLELQVPEDLHLDICHSSGSIEFQDVGGDFTVERDSSGSIAANGIGGDFTVLKDGSGGIEAENVTGSVSLPSD